MKPKEQTNEQPTATYRLDCSRTDIGWQRHRPGPGCIDRAAGTRAAGSQGYTNVKDVKFEDGMWEADATSADGKKVDVKLDPRNGTVYPDKAVSHLDEADIRAQLSSAGYTGVSDVKLDDGMWKAKGRTATGEKVEIRLDSATGAVVAQEKD